MKAVFKDQDLNAEFDENGYVVLDGLDTQTARSLYKVLNGMKSGVDGKFYASLWSSDKKYRQKVDDIIKEHLEPLGKSLLIDYVSLFSDLLVKKPSLFHHFDAHQDWTFVDEEKYASVYMWCPLQDVHPRNGCLYLLPGSHKILDKVRGSNIPPSYEKIKSEIRNNKMIPIKAKSGQLVIFNQAVLHASPPNRTLANRLAIGLLFLPGQIPIYHYHLNKHSNKVEKLPVDYNFFMDFSDTDSFIKALYSGNIEIPKASVAEEYDPDFKEMTMEEFNELYSALNPVGNKHKQRKHSA